VIEIIHVQGSNNSQDNTTVLSMCRYWKQSWWSLTASNSAPCQCSVVSLADRYIDVRKMDTSAVVIVGIKLQKVVNSSSVINIIGRDTWSEQMELQVECTWCHQHWS